MFLSLLNAEWKLIFSKINPTIMEKTIKEYIKVKDNLDVFPKFSDIFSFTNYCSPKDIKVICIGQDCYHQLYYDKTEEKMLPQATGLAFSVPKNCPIPPSLINIYDNMYRYKHIIKKPEHGNLEYLAHQGVLLLNTSLTVEKSKPNSHQYIWSNFTNELIKILTEEFNNLVVVLWGTKSYEKIDIIKNKETHTFIISSHPSPLGFKNKMKGYDSFYNTDHFGLINIALKKYNKKEINWQI
jgi:uracil-DNA glycosylase